MKLSEYLRPKLVILELDAAGVEGALRQLVEPLAESSLIEDVDDVVNALLERESVQSTGIGGGMAIPHAVCDELDEPVVALGVSRAGVEFGALDERPVHTFFLLLSPPERSGTHIKLLARIARLVRQSGFVDELLAASTADEVIERIRQLDEQHA